MQPLPKPSLCPNSTMLRENHSGTKASVAIHGVL